MVALTFRLVGLIIGLGLVVASVCVSYRVGSKLGDFELWGWSVWGAVAALGAAYMPLSPFFMSRAIEYRRWGALIMAVLAAVVFGGFGLLSSYSLGIATREASVNSGRDSADRVAIAKKEGARIRALIGQLPPHGSLDELEAQHKLLESSKRTTRAALSKSLDQISAAKREVELRGQLKEQEAIVATGTGRSTVELQSEGVSAISLGALTPEGARELMSAWAAVLLDVGAAFVLYLSTIGEKRAASTSSTGNGRGNAGRRAMRSEHTGNFTHEAKNDLHADNNDLHADNNADPRYAEFTRKNTLHADNNVNPRLQALGPETSASSLVSTQQNIRVNDNVVNLHADDLRGIANDDLRGIYAEEIPRNNPRAEYSSDDSQASDMQETHSSSIKVDHTTLSRFIAEHCVVGRDLSMSSQDLGVSLAAYLGIGVPSPRALGAALLATGGDYDRIDYVAVGAKRGRRGWRGLDLKPASRQLLLGGSAAVAGNDG